MQLKLMYSKLMIYLKLLNQFDDDVYCQIYLKFDDQKKGEWTPKGFVMENEQKILHFPVDGLKLARARDKVCNSSECFGTDIS